MVFSASSITVAYLLVATITLLSTPSHSFTLPSTPEAFRKWLCADKPERCASNPKANAFVNFRKSLIEKMHDASSQALSSPASLRSVLENVLGPATPDQATHRDAIIKKELEKEAEARQKKKTNPPPSQNFTPPGNDPFPYYSFVPLFVERVVANGHTYSWSAPCFQDTTAMLTMLPGNTSLSLAIRTARPTSLTCYDTYLFGTFGNLQVKTFFFSGDNFVSIPLANFTPSELWDVKTNGVRVFRFIHDSTQLLYDIMDTVALFLEPLTHAHVDDNAADHNLYFLANYPRIPPPMTPRPNSTVITLPETYIRSGDYFGVVRLDGLDPMLAWAMGATTGHTVVALQSETNSTMYICESTATSSYWARNGVQCTEYREWMQLASDADYNVVYAPLRPDLSAAFNLTAAWEWVAQTNGLDYGYHNLLWGWIDTVRDNYPCIPPNYDMCLTWELVEVLFAYLDKVAPAVGNILFNQAWNLRLNTTGLVAADLFYAAHEKNIAPITIPSIVEQDSWDYNTTRDGVPAVGKAEVCCVFVCNIWKQGGVFGDMGQDFQCGEQMVNDIYMLNIFDDNRTGANRPTVCQQQDPSNPLCQIMGKYTLQLNDFNTRTPYPHMDERCPTLAPQYSRPSDC